MCVCVYNLLSKNDDNSIKFGQYIRDLYKCNALSFSIGIVNSFECSSLFYKYFYSGYEIFKVFYVYRSLGTMKVTILIFFMIPPTKSSLEVLKVCFKGTYVIIYN